MNEGKLLLHYLGDGAGDRNLPIVEVVTSAILRNNGENELLLTFELDYPKLPFRGEIRFNLQNNKSQYDDLFLFLVNAVVLSPEEFLLISDFVWAKEDDTENFEVIARFRGNIPSELKHKVCP